MPEMPDSKPVISSIIIDWVDPKNGGRAQQTVVDLRDRSPEQAVADFVAEVGASRILSWRNWL